MKKFNILFCLFLLAPAFAHANEDGEDFRNEPIPKGVGFVDELIASDLNPSRVFGLVEMGLGTVIRYPARFLDYHKTIMYPRAAGQANHWIVASPFNIPEGKKDLLFTFFLIEEKQAFAGTPVVKRGMEQIVSESKPIVELEKDVTEKRDKLMKQITMLEGLEKDLAELRKRAAEIAGVESIIDLKMELSELEGFSSEQQSEKSRIEKLIKLGRVQTQPKGLPARRRELQAQLKEAAKVTAMADRLNSRKRNAALTKVRSQIGLVKQTNSFNRELLAKEALKLRRKRKALEAKLNMAGSSNDEF